MVFFKTFHIQIPIVATVLIALAGCQEFQPRRETLPDTERRPASAQIVSPSSHKDLSRIFSLHDYSMDSLEEGVPKLIVTSLPNDLDRISRVSEKKRLFFLTMLPMILMANEEIRQERVKMLSVLEQHNRGVDLRPAEAEFVAELAEKYKIKGDPLENQEAQDKLVLRVDVLPPSLVLAQAANESAWGTSRFAQRANNLFGEWTFTPGTGLVPKDRPAGATYEVRKFPTVYDSVKSYLRNINTHRAYHDLRLMRARMRTENLPLLGAELAKGLTAYSTRREEYVREIAAMIRHNDLSEFSTATLRGT